MYINGSYMLTWNSSIFSESSEKATFGEHVTFVRNLDNCPLLVLCIRMGDYGLVSPST
jgi:hypothetical protein